MNHKRTLIEKQLDGDLFPSSTSHRITQEQLDNYTVLSVASKHLGYKSRNSLEQFIKQGELPFIKIGTIRLFHWSDINSIKE